MFARKVQSPREGDLYTRIGAFLAAQGLGPDPANYAFAYQLLARDDAAARQAIARLCEDGVRLSRAEIEAMGGNVVAGPGLDQDGAASRQEAAADRVVAQTQAQVETVAGLMRAMHDETRGFGRDLAEGAAAFGAADAPVATGEIARLTRAMIARAADTEERLARAAAETDALRAQLAEARLSARRDPLTGLANRRAFAEAFDTAGKAKRGRCLALCDIDRFKRINDEFGHAVGDRVLSAVARLLADRFVGQVVARLGGEEFAVLIDAADAAAAAALLDAAREAVGERRFRTRDTDAPIGRVSFSAGLVTVAAGEALEDALARADALLYRAKAAGRDRVIAG